MTLTTGRRGVAVGMAAGAAVLASPRISRAQETKLQLKLDWSLYGTHAIFYAGIAQGLYKAEGVDLSIAEGNSSGNVVRLVASGNDPLAFIDFGTMAIGIANGMPIRAIYAIHQKNPMVIISSAANPVRGPKDLEGKVIAMAPSESTAQMYPALLAKNGIEAGKISVLNPAIGAKNALLMQGRTDAVTGVTYFALPIFARNNFAVHHFAYADHGVPALEGGIVVNRPWAERNEALLKRFVAGTRKAVDAAKRNPEGTIDAALSLRSDRARDREVLLAQLKLGLDLIGPSGEMAEKEWQDMIAAMTEAGLIKQPRPLDDYFTNSYSAG